VLVGIDPGLTGAVAVLQCDGTVEVYDTPTLTISTTRGRKQEYDIPGMVQLLRPYVGSQVHLIVETSQAMPGQGVRSTWTTGYGYGLWLGVIVSLSLPFTSVRPGDWKRTLGLGGKDKEAARLRAQQLFPGADLRRKRDHNRAEALLLAWWGQRRHPG
jgi:hypothetical protein